MRLSKHFDSSEFACRCGCDYKDFGAEVSQSLIKVLEKIRDACGGVPLEISSGVRCPRHNRDVGGVENSQHVFGTAADIICPEGMTPLELAMIAEDCGADGIGIYSDFVHIDMRGYPARW